MRPGKEMDSAVAEKVFGKRGRSLPAYSKDIEAAWEVATKMGISVIPIEDGSWFALVGNKDGWKSPAEFIEFLQSGAFMKAGAAVAKSAPEAICEAALNAVQSRKVAASDLN